MNKTSKTYIKILKTLATVAATRIACVLVLSFLAYMTDDPGSYINAYSVIARMISDGICAFIIVRSFNPDFSRASRVVFAVAGILALSVAELIAGKIADPQAETAFIMMPVAVACAVFGALLACRKKNVHQKRRTKKKQRS